MTFHLSTEIISLPFPASIIIGNSFDIDKNRNWIAIIESEGGLRLRSSWSDIRLPIDLPHAVVRWLGNNALVTFPRMTHAGDINAWIIDPQDGGILKAFSIGDGVQDVLVLNDFIAVSYFDEGVFSFIRPSQEGLAIFDRNGTYLWGYAGSVKGAVDIVDCYAMCPTGPNNLAFCAYKGFELVEIDLKTQEQIITATPSALHGSRTITYQSDIVFFHGPYPCNQNSGSPGGRVFAFSQTTKKIVEVQPLPHASVRGLSRGRMLAASNEGLLVATYR